MITQTATSNSIALMDAGIQACRRGSAKSGEFVYTTQ